MALPMTDAVHLKPRTLEAMERWVRWRHDAAYYGTSGRPVGASGNLLGRLQAGGKRRATCPQCKGDKRIPMPGTSRTRACPKCEAVGVVFEDLEVSERIRTVPCAVCYDADAKRGMGEVNGRTCHKCGGSGEVIDAERYVHPVLIPGTRIYGRHAPDRISALINRTVFRWGEHDATLWWHHVVIAEYEPEPSEARLTQEQRALRMGISPRFFRKCMRDAHLAIQGLLETVK